MDELSLIVADKQKKRITSKQEKQIANIYSQISSNISEELKVLNPDKNVSSAIRKSYLATLQKQINEQLDEAKAELHTLTIDNIRDMAQAVIDSNTLWLKNVGFGTKGMFSNVPEGIVESITTGKVYSGNWSLSSRIWKYNKSAKEDINTIIAKGVAQNKSTYDIAKDLEKYVNPSAVKPWDWSKVYPGVSKKIDYNAQRLARTLVQHAYQQSILETTKNNPWVEGYRWLSSHSTRTCMLCAERDGQIFRKGDVPLDHPNGLCNIIPVIEKSQDEVIDDIVNWYNSPEGTYPDIDRFSKGF